MAKIGRNDPCPCGSGKKYKKCCEPRDVAAAAQQMSTAATSLQAVRGAMQSALSNWISEEDDLDRVSNSVLDLIKEGKLDEAEQVGQVLLRDYPDVHDGFERLGMVFEARGNRAQAREMYHKALDFILTHDGYDDELGDWLREKITALSPVTPPQP
jgi:tetratricopeptide (TPR) repeat protein